MYDTPALTVFLCVLAAAFSATHAVRYNITIAATNSTGGTRFQNEIGTNFTVETMVSATGFIWDTFNETVPEDRRNWTTVHFFYEDTQLLAYTSGDEIHFNAGYFGKYEGNVTGEFAGVLYHEMTHVWQWDGNGATPTGLIEGIADYVRLKAGYVPSHWVKAGAGDRWDQGYDVTAWFLDYCNGLRDGFVAKLNKKMRTNYTEDYFVELLGKGVDQLWQDYKANYAPVPAIAASSG
ncbi:hypothetical protein MLD38_013413 [Melastoma candidum]|nr:hypothetical protein MLD38_013413 [Melastoma candidum]